ncbi:vesicular glutamate transporter 1 [Cylas formicarius]|uniref:vesicular glutamate transporter 1 n=1 Tax=Cylas formicarius TaxID=197179 RepID=UPI00295899DA|nr:vesicular glutamate transporter 1 [Cylas formicarius]
MTVGWQTNDSFDNSLKRGTSEVADDISVDSIPEYQRPPLRKIDEYVNAEIPCLSRRATVALLACVGFIIMFGMRGIMGMVNAERARLNITETDEGTTAEVESAIFWGYFVTQIPGGLIAAAYPANKLFGAAIGTSCLLNFLIPSLYDYPNGLIIVKVMQGLVEGVTYPACHGIMRYWAPPLERSRLATIAFSGCYAGIMFSMMICGLLMNNISLMAPYYFYSIVGLIWYMAWLWLVFERPSLHTCIDPKELIMIEKSLGGTQQNYVAPNLTNTPWKEFFTSLPCYAIFVANFCRSWNFYLLVIFQPSYFSQAFRSTTAENASLGALPHFLMTLVVPAGGILADRLRKRGILNTTQVRKLFNCGGFGLEATFFLAMAFSHTTLQGMTALTIGVAFSGFAISGFNVNHLDIAPRYASILMGLSNGIGTIAGALVPVVKKIIVRNEHDPKEWRILIIVSAMIHYAGIIFYGFFASGELQPWADPTVEEEKHWNQMNEAVPVAKYPPAGVVQGQFNGLLSRQGSGGGIVNYGAAMETSLASQAKPVPPRPPAPRSLSQESQHSQQGSVVPVGNPFRTSATSSGNPFRQETVQPAPEDVYMHGTPQDRLY